MPHKKRKQLFIISGYSGSGKTMALRSIEDLGFYCVDNLPADLLQHFSKLLNANINISKIAVVIDARGKDFMRSFEQTLKNLKAEFDVQIIFFEADLVTVTKRFKESRLRHPLSLHGTIKAGYNAEKVLLNTIRQNANLILNTSLLNVHSHKAVVQKYVLRNETKKFEVNLMSFGYKFGIPAESDIVLDVRFLTNPFFVVALKHKTGLNKQVKNYVYKDKMFDRFSKKTKIYLEGFIKMYKKSGKNLINISFGCTGGKHRSVAVAEWMYDELKKDKRMWVSLEHRDIKES